MRIEPVDRVAAAFAAVRGCYYALLDVRSTGRQLIDATYDQKENDYRPAPLPLVEEFRDAGRWLEEAIGEAVEVLEPMRARLHFASTETVEAEDLCAPTWAELVVAIAEESVQPRWLERTECEDVRDLRDVVFEMLRRRQSGGRSRSFVESELSREESRLRSGVAPIRHAPSNGLWRVESGEVVFTEEALKLRDMSRRILDQLILACGKPVSPLEFGRGAWLNPEYEGSWLDPEYEPDATAIKSAVSRLRKDLREAGYDDIADRIPDGEKGCYRLRTA